MKPLSPIAAFAVVALWMPLAVMVPAAVLESVRFSLLLGVAFLLFSLPYGALMSLVAWSQLRAERRSRSE
jgi:hypothetical protein